MGCLYSGRMPSAAWLLFSPAAPLDRCRCVSRALARHIVAHEAGGKSGGRHAAMPPCRNDWVVEPLLAASRLGGRSNPSAGNDRVLRSVLSVPPESCERRCPRRERGYYPGS